MELCCTGDMSSRDDLCRGRGVEPFASLTAHLMCKDYPLRPKIRIRTMPRNKVKPAEAGIARALIGQVADRRLSITLAGQTAR